MLPIDHVLQGCARRDGREVVVHDVARAECRKDGIELQVLRFRPCRVEEKPADEHEPEAVERKAGEEEEDAANEKQIADQFAYAAGNASRPAKAMGTAPGDRAQHAPAIEGKSGDDVERGEQQVDGGEVAGNRLGLLVAPAQREPGGRRDEGDDETGHRAGDSDHELFAGCARLARQVGDAPKDEERDTRDFEAAADGHERVGELVDEHRDEQEHGGDAADGPVGPSPPAFVLLGEDTLAQRKRDEAEDEKPRGMDLDVDAGKAGNTKRPTEHARTLQNPGRCEQGRGSRSLWAISQFGDGTYVAVLRYAPRVELPS